MADYIVRAIAKDAGLRLLVCSNPALVNEVVDIHPHSRTATAVLGQALTGAALIGALLKVQQRTALKFVGNGPIKKVVVESDSYGKVRGYVAEPLAAVEPLDDGGEDISAAVGLLGALTVVRDLRLQDLSESIVPLADGSIDRDIEFYLMQSEQTESLVQIGVQMGEVDGDGSNRVVEAGGILLQAMPNVDQDAFDAVKNRLAERPPVENVLAEGLTPADIIAELLDGYDFDLLEERPLMFYCGCSRERSEKAIISLGSAEIQSLIDQQEAIVNCHFCGREYIFDSDALESLLEQAVS